MSKRRFVQSCGVLFVTVICLSAAVHFVPSFLLAITVLVGGMACDRVSTYIYAKKLGLPLFLSREQNPVLKTLVEKSGLIRGLLSLQVHPKKLLSLAVWIVLGGALYLPLSLLLSGTFKIFSAVAIGIFVFGIILFFTTINNFLLLFSDISSS